MLNKIVVATKHSVEQLQKRAFKELSFEQAKSTILLDLKPLNIRHIELSPKKKNNREVYKVWVKGGRQYRILIQGNKAIILTCIQQTRKTNKYSNL